jgi:ribosomal protein L14
MRRLLSVIAVAAGLAALTGGAQALPTSLARTSAKAADDGHTVNVINNNDVLVCKYVAQVGSRISTPVCHTALEWKHMHDYSREYLEELSRSAAMGGKVF